MKYREEIDGLRSLAVLSVVFYHAGFTIFSGGFIGVDIFFVISGYLITSIINKEIQEGNFSLINFYERRIKRILPVLFFVITASFIFGWIILLPEDYISFAKSINRVVLFTSNYFFYKDSSYFAAAASTKPMLHTWSLAIEEQYYLIIPILMICVSKKNKKELKYFLFVLIFISFYLCINETYADQNKAFFISPYRIWELIAGSLLSLYMGEKSKVNTYKTEIISAIGILIIIYCITSFKKTILYPGYFSLLPIIAAILIIATANKNNITGKFLSHKIMVGIGLISYSIYLWHQVFFAFLKYVYGEDLNLFIQISGISATLIVSFFSWKYIEQPFRNLKIIGSKGIYGFAIVGSLLILYAAQSIKQNEGFISRYNAEKQNFLKVINKKNRGSYVEEKFNSLKMKAFDNNSSKIKLLIIGDSFAQDLVNAIVTSKFNKKLQISTYYVPAKCGNLYMEKEKFIDKIFEGNLKECNKINIYNNTKINKLMRESDFIWFASSWTDWQAIIISLSVKNLNKEFKGKFRIFGSKNFGNINLYKILNTKLEDQGHLISEPNNNFLKINLTMKNNIPENIFINTQELFCTNNGRFCKVFSKNGDLISYDGKHLTPAGAKDFGEKLNYLNLFIKDSRNIREASNNY